MITAQIISDSLGPGDQRLTTFSLIYPRIIHSEVMTHRMFSRNAASSRAIPISKMRAQIIENPAMPVYWGKNMKGMQAQEELTGRVREEAVKIWLQARTDCMKHAQRMEDIEVHKQIANRLTETWMLMNTILTATEFDNYYNLRDDPPAQPEFRVLAGAMLKVHNEHEPIWLEPGQWHLPYVQPDERAAFPIPFLQKYSVARCARVSYKTHEGVVDHDRDVLRHDELLASGHVSPFEHQATPLENPNEWSGNFKGFKQYRKTLIGENRGDCPRFIKKRRSRGGEQAGLGSPRVHV
jgi:thymidylate synthase ThyX